MDQREAFDAKYSKLALLNQKFPTKKLLYLHMRDVGKCVNDC